MSAGLPSDGAEFLRTVYWRGPSIERPGLECAVVESDPARGAYALYEGKPGEMTKVSVDVTMDKACEKARLVLAGDPGALADVRVMVALAVIVAATMEKRPETPDFISIRPKQTEKIL